MTIEERLDKLLHLIIDDVLEEAKTKLPDTHLFRPIGCRFRIPESPYIGTLAVHPSETDRHKRRVHISVQKETSDRAYQNILSEMSSEQIRQYLADPAAFAEIKQCVKQLHARALDEDD